MTDDLTLFRALRSIASDVNAGEDDSETLGRVLRSFCRESHWAGAVIMRVEACGTAVRVVARHDPGGLAAGPERSWPLDESPARIALETGEPVILPDAQAARAFPGYRREARTRGYRTVVILPMRFDDGERAVLAACSRDAVAVSERDIAFLQLVVHLGAIALERTRSLQAERAFARRLDTILRGHAVLLERVLADGSVPAVVSTLAEILPDAFVVVDLATRQVICQRSPCPDVLDAARWANAASGDLRPSLLKLAREVGDGAAVQSREITLPLGKSTLRRSVTLCPLKVDGESVGTLVVFSSGRDDRRLDDLLLDSARFGLSVQMMRSHVRFAAETRNVETLLAGLLNGTGVPADLEEQAARLGFVLPGPARLVVLAPLDPGVVARSTMLDALRAVASIARRHDGRTVAAVWNGQLVVHGPTAARDEPRWLAFVRDCLEEVQLALGRPIIAVRSRICTIVAEYPPAFRDCERIIALGRRFGRSGELTAQDFGPFPVLMSAVDTAEMRNYVQDLIGAVAQWDATRGTAYLMTLSAYLDGGCRAQACAVALGLHVTTLRYRLSRLRELFGLRFDTPDQRFALQLALRFRNVLAPPSEPPPVRSKRKGTASREPREATAGAS